MTAATVASRLALVTPNSRLRARGSSRARRIQDAWSSVDPLIDDEVSCRVPDFDG
jgi:hypothetical protein